MRKILGTGAIALVISLVSGCGNDDELDSAHSEASVHTAEANQAVAESLPLEDPTDFEEAGRGLIAQPEQLLVKNEAGKVIWDMSQYKFMGISQENDAPDSANPSLWRQAKLNNIHGLFEVVPGVWQLRGFDLANMTIIDGRTGWIIIDPLTTTETSRAALEFARQHLGDKPIRAVIYSHTHIDHFGGVLGVVSAEDVQSGKVRVIGPHGFTEEATSENILAGLVMARRAGFMYGRDLERSPRGHIGTGLGKSPAFGTASFLEPTELVDHTGQTLDIDGVEFVFQYTPNSEAPAEMAFYLPDRKLFCGAEVVSRNLHNLYTLRGAKVRDALLWSGYIDEARALFPETEVYVGTHHWPMWGRERIVDFMEKQRDAYKYIHDQTMRLASQGLTPDEIADTIRMPESLRTSFFVRDYYGTIRHNSRAVYQNYFGWYDGNPANLNPLPNVERAERYVSYMGGADKVVEKTREAFEEGDYRWVAEVMNQVVFAEPDNEEARELLANAYDQLAYQAESGPWRDVYLSAALELRKGETENVVHLSDMLGMLRYTPLERFFDAMATRLDPEKAEDMEMTVNMVFTDIGEIHVLELKNSVMRHYKREQPDPDASVTMNISHELYLKLAINSAGIRETIFSDDLDIDGSRIDLVRFFTLFDKPDPIFSIVTP